VHPDTGEKDRSSLGSMDLPVVDLNGDFSQFLLIRSKHVDATKMSAFHCLYEHYLLFWKVVNV